MGENEQGGMLRTVVVLGLVAIIAGTLISGIKVLKGQMSTLSTQATNMVGTTLTSEKASNDVTHALRYTSDNIVSVNGYANGVDTSKWSFGTGAYHGANTYLGQDDQGQAAMLSQGQVSAVSPIFSIPDGAKTMTVSFRSFATTGSYYFYANALTEKSYGQFSVFYGSQGYYAQGFSNSDPSWKNYSFNIDLKAADGTYSKTGRQTQLQFHNGDYSAPTGTPTGGISQIQVSFQ